MSRIAKALMAVVMSVGLVASGAVAAQAVFTPPPDCTTVGRVCVYENANYDIQMGWRSPPFALQNISTTNRNKLSSYANNSNSNAAWYDNINGGGDCYNMPTFTKKDEYNIFERDRAESWKSGSC